MSDDLEFIVIDDIPEYIFCIGDDEENERVIALSGKDGAFKYEKVAELPTTGEDGVLYLVPKSHTTQTASGNPINVNITDNAGKIESLKLDGDTFQQSFVGGQPSPNPSYPQDINVVTGTQTISINDTNYTISLGSLELCKLGTYQDYIWKDGEDWKVHKAIKKLQMADTTAWVKRADGQFYSENWAEINEVNDETGFCSHFIYSTTVWYGVGYYGISSAGNLWLTTGDTTLTSITLFETWLNTKKPIAYQPLATPTDTTITDTDLIAQLEAVQTAALSTGSNTISNTATGTNLAGDLEIGYYGYDPLNKYDKYFWLDVDGAYESL